MENNDELAIDASIMRTMRQGAGAATDPYLLRCIEYSVSAKTYKILTDREGTPCGYIIWASVNRETIQKIIRVGVYPRFFYEWREGGISLFLDVFNACEKTASCEETAYVKTQIKNCVREQRILFYGLRGRFTLRIRKRNIFSIFSSEKINRIIQ